MASLKISIPHKLSEDEALKRIKKLLSEIKKEHGDRILNLKEKWVGSTNSFFFEAMGSPFSGTLKVTSSRVDIEGTIPFTASLFKGKISRIITKQAEELLKK